MVGPISTTGAVVFPVSLKEGDRVIVKGSFNPQGSGASFNFTNEDGSVVLFHFNPRINDKVQVNNTYINGAWGTEERVPNIFKAGVEVEIAFVVFANHYQVLVNGNHFVNYNHRQPFANAKTFIVSGGFTDQSIQKTEAKVKTYNVGELIVSPSKTFFATVQADGNFVLYQSASPGQYVAQPALARWASGTDQPGQPPRHLDMQTDGNLVLYDPAGKPVWAAGSNAPGNVFELRVQDDGNMVIYNGSNQATWATGTRAIATAPKNFAIGEILWSPAKKFFGIFQADGNFVVYRSDDRKTADCNPAKALWSLHTERDSHPKPYKPVMQADGNLVIYDANNGVVWASLTCCGKPVKAGNNPFYLQIEDDGNASVFLGTERWCSVRDYQKK